MPKLDFLRVLCAIHTPDCVCIVESWLDNDIQNSELCINGYDVVRLDRNRHGGGVLLYINSVLTHSIVYSGSTELELVIVSIMQSHSLAPLTMALFYRPPSSPYNVLDNLLTILCTYIDPSCLANFILLGDFNINFFDTSHPLFSKLTLVSNSLSLTQVVTVPTHVTSTCSSLIDLVFLSTHSNLIFCETVAPLSNSDHLGLSLAVSAVKAKCNPKRSGRKIWRYALADYDLAHEMLDAIDWSALFQSSDVNTCWALWHTKFLQVMEACIPQSVLKARKNLPWLTKSVIQAMRRRNSLFRAAKRSDGDDLWNKYKTVRNQVVALLRLNKEQYFHNLQFSTSREFWKAIKVLNKQDSTIPTLWDDNTPVTSDSGKADLLNRYFHDCFNHSFPPLKDLTPLDPNSCPASILCTEEQVTELLQSLNPTKSTGLDGVSATMLKSTATAIAPSLTKLFNISIATGCFPKDWKCARITPIFKSSDPSLPKNYRPISILPIVSKLLERHVHSLVFRHLLQNCPISPFQWGFMPRRSTTSALCTLVHDWLSQLDNGNEICSIFFDVRKAFDSVPHSRLMSKLSTLQLCPYLHHWVHSYLAERSQVVVVDGKQSPVVNVVSGVPQGSVLGPLLFIIYIDDVTSKISPSSTISLFADDIALYRCIRSPADYTVLQSDITAITMSIEIDGHLKLHDEKCCCMFISRKRTHSATPPLLYIRASSPIHQVDSVKYLGVILTSDLTWTKHITLICSKVRKLTGMLYRRFFHCDPQLMLRLYKAFIRPHFEYAPQVWDPHLVKNIQLLEKSQKFALRVCTRNWSATYAELLDSTNVPSLSERRKIAKLCQLYKLVYKLTDCQNPPVAKKPPSYSRRRNPIQLQCMKARSSQFQSSFYPHTISLWNNLTLSNDSLNSIVSFKRSIT